MTDDMTKRIAFNEQAESSLRDHRLSEQARSFLQWRIAKNREHMMIDKYVEDLLKREEPQPKPWKLRFF